MTTVIQFPEAGPRDLAHVVSGEVKALMGRFSVTQTELAEWLDLKQSAVSARLNGNNAMEPAGDRAGRRGIRRAPCRIPPGALDRQALTRTRVGAWNPKPSDPKVLPLWVA